MCRRINADMDAVILAKPKPLPLTAPQTKRAVVYARPNTRTGCLGRPPLHMMTLSPRIVLTRASLSELFRVPLHAAAAELGISISTLKGACRKLGVDNWPYRALLQQKQQLQFQQETAAAAAAAAAPQEAPSQAANAHACPLGSFRVPVLQQLAALACLAASLQVQVQAPPQFQHGHHDNKNNANNKNDTDEEEEDLSDTDFIHAIQFLLR